jgi:hypothetical protein
MEKMKPNTAKIFETIKTTVKTICDDLKDTNGTGIYFSPELYVAFCIGKEIARKKQTIFGAENVEWLREINLGNGGPSDIAFKTADTYTVIELKLRDNVHSYKADIEKLKKLPETTTKLFCVLLDSFSAENDERLKALETDYKEEINRIGHFSFPTWNNWYKKQIFCNVNLYQVK